MRPRVDEYDNDEPNHTPEHETYHALMVVGYDRAEGHVVLRDEGSNHLFKGFVKVPKHDFEVPHSVERYLQITVKEAP